MKRNVSVLVSALLLAACGDGGAAATSGSASGAKPAGSTSAKPATSGSATPTASATTSATGETPALSASAPASASAAPAASGAPAVGGGEMPADLKKVLDLVKDPTDVKDPKLEGFFLRAPASAKITESPAPGEWNEISVDGASMAFLAHSPSDGGDGCPKLADMKGKVKDGKALVELDLKMKPWGKESYGDEAQLYLFEKDGKAGFYGTKVFKIGKEPTTYCCAAGNAAEGPAMKGMLEKAKAETLAGICMGIMTKF